MNKRWREIDGLYALGIFLVIIGHAHSSDWNTFKGTILEKVICFIYMFHMPLFFFIAGFLFQNSDRLNQEGYGNWLKEKAARLLTPYFFWSLIGAFPKCIWEKGGVDKGLQMVVETVVYPRESVWGHFWFIPVLFFTYAIFGLIGKKTELSKMWSYTIVCLIVYFLPFRVQYFGFSDLRTALIFFAVGELTHTFGRCLQSAKRARLLSKILYCVFATSFCIVITGRNYSNRVIGLFVALIMISVSWILATIVCEWKIVGWISCHNFTMYIFSWLFQAVAMVICKDVGWVKTFFLMSLVGYLGPIVLIMLYEHVGFLHIKPIKLILGVR